MTTTSFFINFLSIGLLISSIFSITSKNPVISIIFLILTFVQAAGYLILLGINFVGVSYIVIYVGAIAVLFLFVIMMINIKLTDILETGNQYTKNLPLAITIASLFIFIFFLLMPYNLYNEPFFNAVLNIFNTSVPILEKITLPIDYINNKLNHINLLDTYPSLRQLSSQRQLSASASYSLIWGPSEYINTAACPAHTTELLANFSLNNSTITKTYSDVLITSFSQIETLGHSLYTMSAILLIILSFILLLSMFAIIIISKKK